MIRTYKIETEVINGNGKFEKIGVSSDKLAKEAYGAMNKPVQSQLVVLGSLSIGGTINKIEELASIHQVCFDAGAKKYFSQ